MLTENGTICSGPRTRATCAVAAFEAYKRGGPTREPLANVLTTNSKIAVCDAAMAATDKANLATSKAQETGQADDHGRAMRLHDEAADQHDSAADERDGDAALVHSVLASSRPPKRAATPRAGTI